MALDDRYIKGHHVDELKYFYSEEQKLLGSEGIRGISTKNIGDKGENLTIAVLSMNRASLTIRLMNSIRKYMPDFAGEFLIGDNGSEEEEKRKLYNKMKKMPFRCRMVEFGKNWGVSGGRNRLYREVQTDWILSLDNDLYLVGNPLKKMQNDLAVLGCHFMALPIVDKANREIRMYGGHLYVENLNNEVGIGGSFSYYGESVCPINEEYPPFLCSFLPGYAAIINKKSFFEAGAFDENMFVGFEDAEFSVRLFQKGMKVGGCGVVSFVHDHPKPENHAAAKYEKKRFATDLLRESGEYFERRHGFSVWNFASEEWVNKRLDELAIGDNEKQNVLLEGEGKKKIAIVIDRRGWALDNIASQMVKNLSDEFDFKRIYLDTIDCLSAVFLMAEDCNLIHFLWRPLPTAIDDNYTKQFIHNLRMTETEFREKYIEPKVVSVGVYDHFFLDGIDKNMTMKLFSDKKSIVDCYTVSSAILQDIYMKNSDIKKKPTALVQDGVDCQLFSPMNEDRFHNWADRTINIGWVGNSKWVVGESKLEDLKGIHTIIKPAIKELQEEGYPIELITSDRNDRMIPHQEMPDFYKSIDIYVCASLCEGTPNPVLEAMACGIPVISTDVGIVREVFGPKQKKYILPERSKECLKNTLRDLLNHLDDLQILSCENQKYIQRWDWTLMSEKFRLYFRYEMEKKAISNKKRSQKTGSTEKNR